MEGRVYTPGAGHRPPLLAGRDAIRHDWLVTCAEVEAVGRVASNDLVLTGPRGVGKTATLKVLGDSAAELGYEVITLQATTGSRGLVESLSRTAERKIVEGQGSWARMKDAFAHLAGVNASVFGVGAGVTLQQRGSAQQQEAADPMSVADALAGLAQEVRAERGRGGVLVMLDEMQVADHDLALLAGSLHRLNVDHPEARVLFAGTGLPNTQAAMTAAGVTHPDRLFNLTPLPANLSPRDAQLAIVEPAMRRGVAWHPDAVDLVVRATGGYPSHLQAFAHSVWATAPGPSMITREDAEVGIRRGAADYERRTIGPRWEAMSDRQKEYLTALALAGGQARSAVVSGALNRVSSQDSYTRAALIKEGDIYALPGNKLALSVPLSGRYAIAHYEDARAEADNPELASLDEMQERLSQSPALSRAERARNLSLPHTQARTAPQLEPPAAYRPEEPPSRGLSI